MAVHGTKLFFAQCFPEGRHEAGEGTDRPAVMRHRHPVCLRFTSGEVAVREIRRRHGESKLLLPDAGAVGAMAGGAGLCIDTFAILQRGQVRNTSRRERRGRSGCHAGDTGRYQ